MAITRLSNSGFKSDATKYDTATAGYPGKMAAPTATDGGTGTTVSVAFTAQSGATSYRAISSPGSFTNTGSSSPIIVSGLTAGTAYTFQIQAQNSAGYGAYSDASNSITPITPSSFESIASSVPSGTGTVTFSSIPSTYKHLQIRYISRASSASGAEDLLLRLNSDTGANYAKHYLQGVGSSATVNSQTSATSWLINDASTGGSAGSGLYAVGIIDIIDYANTSKYKTMKAIWGKDQIGSGIISHHSAHWRSTAAVSTISIALSSGNYSGAVFSLYGIKG